MTMNTDTVGLLDELIEQSVAKQQRDASIPAGTILSEYELEEGAVHREVKTNSMVRRGKTPLPERFAAFDKFGVMSMLPTAQMNRMLAKERADSPGERAFHVHTRGTTQASCSICPPQATPIDALCNHCTGVRSQKPTFYSEEQLIAHKRVAHTLEYQTELEALERADRRASIEAQNKLAEAMLEVARTNNAPTTRRKSAEE